MHVISRKKLDRTDREIIEALSGLNGVLIVGVDVVDNPGTSRQRTRDLDALLFTPLGALAIEGKGSYGKRGELDAPGNGPWSIDGDESVFDQKVPPSVQVDLCAKIYGKQSGLYVQRAVAVAGEGVTLATNPKQNPNCFVATVDRLPAVVEAALVRPISVSQTAAAIAVLDLGRLAPTEEQLRAEGFLEVVPEAPREQSVEEILRDVRRRTEETLADQRRVDRDAEQKEREHPLHGIETRGTARHASVGRNAVTLDDHIDPHLTSLPPAPTPPPPPNYMTADEAWLARRVADRQMNVSAAALRALPESEQAEARDRLVQHFAHKLSLYSDSWWDDNSPEHYDEDWVDRQNGYRRVRDEAARRYEAEHWSEGEASGGGLVVAAALITAVGFGAAGAVMLGILLGAIVGLVGFVLYAATESSRSAPKKLDLSRRAAAEGTRAEAEARAEFKRAQKRRSVGDARPTRTGPGVRLRY